MKKPMVWLLLTMAVVATGCKSLLPRESSTVKTRWTNFNDIQIAFDQIEPYKTTADELRNLGFDPYTVPNVRILTYLDIIERFLPNASVTKDDLHKAVRACLDAKDGCQAYELDLTVIKKQRYGNVPLDVFGFQRKTKITGWNFKALIVMQNNLVVYKLRAGEPAIEEYEKKFKPLGPFQELDRMVVGVATKLE